MKHIVVGVVLVVMGLWGMVAWWSSFGLVMRGLIPSGLLALGLIATLSGYHRLGDREPLDDDEMDGGD